MRKIKHHHVFRTLMIGMFINVLSPLGFAIESAKEHEIKAAYLFNLGSYISWPEALFANESDNFTICIVGQHPALVATLRFIALKRKINGHSSVVQTLERIEEADVCQIVFIPRDQEMNMTDINTWHQKKPVLLVSDMDRFIRLGGMIEFYMLNNRVRLAMDPESISDSGLKPSSQLMRVAQLRSR